MNPLDQRVWLTLSGEETETLGGQLLGAAPVRGAPCRIVTLSGDLGAGKSTFARGALRALGVKGAIKSPSYTLLETYALASITVVHLDLYRLKDPAELEYLGLADYHRSGHLWLVEWPEHGGDRIPAPDLEFVFTIGPDGHRIERIEKFSART